MMFAEESPLEFNDRAKVKKELSLIPLINVVFLLLIFFLVAGTIKRFDIVEVSLPQAESSQLLDEGYVEIILGRHDEIILNDELVSPAQLRQGLSDALAKSNERIITLKADAALDAAKMLAIMDMLKALGAKNVSLVTEVER